jgi:hypothetical protein
MQLAARGFGLAGTAAGGRVGALRRRNSFAAGRRAVYGRFTAGVS